jgi:hypothetical protein
MFRERHCLSLRKWANALAQEGADVAIAYLSEREPHAG